MAGAKHGRLEVDSFSLDELRERMDRSIVLDLSKGWKRGPKRGAARFLALFQCVESLVLSSYSGTGAGRHLARIVRECQHLRELTVVGLLMPQQGLDRILFAAGQHQSLRSLSLIHTPNPGASALLALCSSLSLRSIHLVGSKVSGECSAVINQCLVRPDCMIESLTLGLAQFSPRECLDLGEALSRNLSVRELCLKARGDSMRIPDIMDSVSHCDGLLSLQFSDLRQEIPADWLSREARLPPALVRFLTTCTWGGARGWTKSLSNTFARKLGMKCALIRYDDATGGEKLGLFDAREVPPTTVPASAWLTSPTPPTLVRAVSLLHLLAMGRPLSTDAVLDYVLRAVLHDRSCHAVQLARLGQVLCCVGGARAPWGEDDPGRMAVSITKAARYWKPGLPDAPVEDAEGRPAGGAGFGFAEALAADTSRGSRTRGGASKNKNKKNSHSNDKRQILSRSRRRRGAVEGALACMLRSGLVAALRSRSILELEAASSERAIFGGGARPKGWWKHDPKHYRRAIAVEQFSAAVRGLVGTLADRRGIPMVQWRRAVEAKRDAAMVFQAAAEGRPLELAKRLRLGVLAGGLGIAGRLRLGDSPVPPLEAARLGGHEACVSLLVQAASRVGPDPGAG